MPELHQFEESDEEIDALAHKKLLDNVGRLNKTQFIKKPTRTEPSAKKTEFQLSKTKSDEWQTPKDATVSVQDLVKVLTKSKKHLDIGKDLRNSQRNRKILEKPLERPVQQRIQRGLGYERTKKKLNRWNAVVTRNAVADHLSFPLQQPDKEMEVIDVQETRPSNFRIKSDLMLEMEAIQPLVDHVDSLPDATTTTATEKEDQLTRAEMIARSKEMRLQRIRESNKSAKARQQNKIKSKKFHKIMKKQKMKEQLKEFETLQKSNPELALEKLEEFEKNRALERALLRHKNTGTWAKNLQVRAKYNQDVRKELAQQLALSRELTQKRPESDDDKSDDEENAPKEPDNEFDAFNPWVKAKGNQPPNGTSDDANFASGYRKYWQERNSNEKAVSEYENIKESDVLGDSSDTLDDNTDTEEIVPRIKSRTGKRKKTAKHIVNGWTVEECTTVSKPSKAKLKKRKKPADPSESIDNIDDLFDDAEELLQQKVALKVKNLKKDLMKREKPLRESTRKPGSRDHLDLSFKDHSKRPKIDEELDEISSFRPVLTERRKELNELKQISSATDSSSVPSDGSNINPNNFMNIRMHHLQTALPEMSGGHDDASDEDVATDRRMTIMEAFADDDIVADFQREKDEEIKKNGPQQIDLTLPGWGSWAGCGIKAKPKKLILKFPSAPPRRDENKGNVVIIENDNKKLRQHQVTDVPFPFTSVKDFEASIRVPMGKEFVPASAHKLLTRPAIDTKLGTIIEPMDKSQLFQKPKKPKSRTEKRIAALQKQ